MMIMQTDGSKNAHLGGMEETYSRRPSLKHITIINPIPLKTLLLEKAALSMVTSEGKCVQLPLYFSQTTVSYNNLAALYYFQKGASK